MYQDIYLTLLQCKHCQGETFIKQVELDHGDWIASCSKCGAQNILAVTLINQVPVLAPPIRVIGLRA
jgi:hypothetical protein